MFFCLDLHNTCNTFCKQLVFIQSLVDVKLISFRYYTRCSFVVDMDDYDRVRISKQTVALCENLEVDNVVPFLIQDLIVNYSDVYVRLPVYTINILL